MSTATAQRNSGASPDLRAGGELAALLDAVPTGTAEASSLPCRTHSDPDLWFADTPAELERAKQLCVGCPLKAECLTGALSRQEPWGVWGGEILERGEVIARKRPRGRPSKATLQRERAAQANSVQANSVHADGACAGAVRDGTDRDSAKRGCAA